MISPFNLSARANETAVLPTAVGPVTTKTFGFVFGEEGDCRERESADPDIAVILVNGLS